MLDIFERILNFCKMALYATVATYTYVQLLAADTPKAERIAELLTGKLGQLALAIAILEAIHCLFNTVRIKSN